MKNRFFIKGLIFFLFILSINNYCQKPHSTFSLSDSTLIKVNNQTEQDHIIFNFNSIYLANDFKLLFGLNNQNLLIQKSYEFNKFTLQKRINKNFHLAFKNIITESESKVIKDIRQYLSISKNVFAIILAVIHALKYY